MTDVLSTRVNYASLSLKDLLDARDAYHYHLLNKTNVVGTAVGLYLIRKTDPYPDRGGDVHLPADRPPRTLANSEVRRYSWPCVHVFVNRWVEASDFGGASALLHPENMVPRTLYLSDGRMVPVCVTLVQQAEASPAIPNVVWPGGLFGGGMPLAIQTQGKEHLATAGCLVSDGHTTYALTNRHVCGESGEAVYTYARGRRKDIGTASRTSLTRKLFTEVYPDFPGRMTYVNLDVGLIELTDLNEWTSRFVNLDSVGALADLNALNMTTRLIDAPVVAMGGASGRIEGRIKALFYRFRSIGGYDYVSDFLIAPRDLGRATARPQTCPGDSGAVWHLITQPDGKEPADEEAAFKGTLRPLAIEWGGQVFSETSGARQAAGRYTFGLATSLTTVCRALDVELVLDHNTGPQPFWGQMGHYTIGSYACMALESKELSGFFNKNIDQISFDFANLLPADIKERIKKAKADSDNVLMPLADVPDLLWKTYYKKVKGGRDLQYLGAGRTTGPEHPCHYADIDVKRPDGKSLQALCTRNKNNISVKFWQQFYDAVGKTDARERGLLPFRIWQFFSRMVEFAENDEPDKFLCAAGILSHYVGDACQPLHCSQYADGYADRPTKVTHRKRDTGEEVVEDSNVGKGVHSTYETAMVDRHATELVAKVLAAMEQSAGAQTPVRCGQDAAVEAFKLMCHSLKTIKPTDIVDTYVDAGGKNVVAVQDALWDEYGEKTAQLMADGARLLARIWEGAWTLGRAGSRSASPLGRVDAAKLIEYCQDLEFVKSLDLDHIGPELGQ